MKIKIIRLWWHLIIILVIANSCNTKDADNIEGPIVYNPTFSFPVGTYNITYNSLFSNMDLPLTDTASVDSLDVIWFEGKFYTDTIGQYDTVIVTVFNFDFLENEQEVIKSILFRLNYSAELPSESYIQLYFDGPSGIRMDSLFMDGILYIEPADTNADGFVESAEIHQKDVIFDESKLDMLQQVEMIELSVGVKTRRGLNEFYKYLARYKIYVQLGIRVEMEAEYN